MKPIKENPVQTRRKYDATFKREAVQNWLSSGKSAEVIAQELGLHAERLYAWRKCFAPAEAGGRAAAGAKPRTVADLESQLEAALRENRHLREQRDILKKRWAFSPNRPRTLCPDRRDEISSPHPGALCQSGSLPQRLLRLAQAPHHARPAGRAKPRFI